MTYQLFKLRFVYLEDIKLQECQKKKKTLKSIMQHTVRLEKLHCDILTHTICTLTSGL